MISPPRLTLSACLFLLASASTAVAQGTKADYQRADGLRALTDGKVFKASIEPHWAQDGQRFWYRNDLGSGQREFVLVDAPKKERRPLFDHAKLAEALAKATGEDCDASRLPVDEIELAGDAVRFNARGKGWRFDPESGAVTEGERVAERAPRPPARGGRGNSQRGDGRRRGGRRCEESPDGKWRVVARDHNLHLRAGGSDEEHPLTRDGTADHFYESGVFWSPDSARFVALRTRKGDGRKVTVIESSP